MIPPPPFFFFYGDLMDDLTYSERKAVGFSLLCVIIMLAITLTTAPAVI
jgi:hypothetical protein